MALRQREWLATKASTSATSASARWEQLASDLKAPAESSQAASSRPDVAEALRLLRDEPLRGGARKHKQWLALAVALGGTDSGGPLDAARCLEVLELCAERGWSGACGALLREMESRGMSLSDALPLALEASAAVPGASKQLLAWMDSLGIAVSPETFDSLLRGCRRHGKFALATSHWARMRSLALWPGQQGLLSYAAAACGARDWRAAYEALREAETAGCEVDGECWRAVLRECTYAWDGASTAVQILDGLRERSVSDFNLVLRMHARHERFQKVQASLSQNPAV